MVYDCTRNIQRWLLPPTCLLCGGQGHGRRDICPGCLADLPVNDAACGRCGRPLPAPGAAMCGQCLRRAPDFDATVSLLRYRPPADTLIHQLKYGGRLCVARLLGELLAERIRRQAATRPEVVLPVPLHPTRARERGFNQALELARTIARALSLPLRPASVVRVRPTQAQSRLPAGERAVNIKGAFAVRTRLQVRHAAIVDDVMTTGLTAEEVARALRAAGVERIDVWVVARAAR